ncbi:MAG: winged helix-turn-helix transcriptional regulator [Clostridia bacterium]|nr:winged helix-turn-helix transcriptional regulator [Clostridia bacterium]
MPSLSRNINVISRCASAYRAERLEGSGISAAHYFYIIAVCKNPGISQDKLAKALYINKSSVARAFQTLENDGFIRREQSESDRRIILVYPTEKAEELFPTICEVSRSWNRYLFEALDEDERELFMSLLEKIAKRDTDYVDSEREGEK